MLRPHQQHADAPVAYFVTALHSGKGFWQAIDFTSDRKSRAAFTDDTVAEIVRRVRGSGVIVGAIGTAIEIAPPYISSQEELDRCTDAVFRAIVDVSRERDLG